MAPNAETASKCPFAAALAAPSKVEQGDSGGETKAHHDTRDAVDKSVTSAAGALSEAQGCTESAMKDQQASMLSQKRVPSRSVGADKLILTKALLPLESVLGLGALLSVLLGLVLPRPLVLLVAAALLLPPIVRTILRSYGVLGNPDMAHVRPEMVTDRMEGEFCVFLLGARSNAPFKLNQDFKYVGDMFGRMMEEVEQLPPEAGFLGADPYIGANMERGSHVMSVMYWRSYEHLLKYTHDSAKSHTSAVKQLTHKLSSMPHIGIWHEAYIIKPGQHESVYANCPPLGLGGAMGLRPAKGPLRTSRGRVKVSGLPAEYPKKTM